MNRHPIPKESFKELATLLANTYGDPDNKLKFCADHTNMTTGEFLEEAKRFDPTMAKHVEAWLKAGQAMGDYIRSRKEVK